MIPLTAFACISIVIGGLWIFSRRKQPAPQRDYEPYWGIVDQALAGRSRSPADLEQHPEYKAPLYVVRMCEALARAIEQQTGKAVPLSEVIRLESTCAGADYQRKLSMRCCRLAQNNAA